MFWSSLSGLSVLPCAKPFPAFFCSAPLSPLVSRISLTSPDSLPFKWVGLLLKGWEGAHHVKSDTHTADTPHACPPTFFLAKNRKKRMRSPWWSHGCAWKNVWFQRTRAVEPLREIVMSNTGRRPKKEKHKCCQLDFSGILLFLGLF